MIRLGIDAMSGDLGSKPAVEAVKLFLKDFKDVELTVVGKEEELTELATLDNVKIVDARDIMEMTDSIMAIRRKKESSLFKTVQLVKNKEVDGMVSCGNTGAYYACCMLFIKRIEGVEKSCLMAHMPTMDGKGVLLLDAGANVENTAEQLVQFGIMGNVYASLIKGIKNPRVSLLNIGAEAKKGTEVRQEAYKLLEKADLNFIGNIEGREILEGVTDVIVTDGFAGNIALKTIEGTAKSLMKMIMEALMSTTKSKIGALLAKDQLKQLKTKFDYKSVGGAMMIGFESPIIKAHGGSDEVAIYNAMVLAKDMVAIDVVSKMKDGLNNEAN